MHPYKGLSLKLPTESFERIPFLDFGGRNANESGKGWSFITTLMNKMEFFPFSLPPWGSNLKS
jgi:hypothetical protein